VSVNQQLLNHASHDVEHQSNATAAAAAGHRQQYDDGAECSQCDSQTNVKARYSSSHTGRQMQSNKVIPTNSTSAYQCQTIEDMDVDGSSAVDNSDLDSGPFDFRSNDGDSTGSSSPRDSCREFSFRTDDSSQTSFSDSMLYSW